MLPAKNRLRTSKEFALTTKTGHRATSLSLVVYQRSSNNLSSPQVGLIVNKTVGGSVTRHRVSRQLRHLAAAEILKFPSNSQIVIRVLRNQPSYKSELSDLLRKILSKVEVSQ